MRGLRRIVCITGRLAEKALRATLASLAPAVQAEVVVLPITVAALMTTEWVARHLPDEMPIGDLLLLPGLCAGNLEPVRERWRGAVEHGPNDLKDLPAYFGRPAERPGYGERSIEIVAEIQHAPRLTPGELLERAEYYRESGADIIDLGCDVGARWQSVGAAVEMLVKRGFRVSVDTFDRAEMRAAADAGAEMILSVHAGNLEAARGLRCRVVVVPGPEGELEPVAACVAQLEAWGVPYVLDPVIAPISFGFAESIGRLLELRRRWPGAELMIGSHHLTELLDADTTGVTAVAAGIAQEVGVRYVLTTEVAAWAHGAVRELDVARRLMHYAQRRGVLPKNLDDGLLTIKDRRPNHFTEPEIRDLAAQVTDPNFRIFIDGRRIYVFNADVFVVDTDIQRIFDQLGVTEATHAFYLGKELARAKIALELGKNYRQEQPLRWGYLTPAQAGGEHGVAARTRRRVRLTQRRERKGGRPA